MQIMKKELDEGYNNLINEFQREQTRLQTRYDQLKQQLTSAQHTIDLLKSNLTQLKTNHFDDITKVKEAYTIEYDHKNRRDNLQQRLENLVKLLEQSNDA
jgi:phage shock protein A